MRFVISKIAKQYTQIYTKSEKQRKTHLFAKKHLKSFGGVKKVRTFATVKRTQGHISKDNPTSNDMRYFTY